MTLKGTTIMNVLVRVTYNGKIRQQVNLAIAEDIESLRDEVRRLPGLPLEFYSEGSPRDTQLDRNQQNHYWIQRLPLDIDNEECDIEYVDVSNDLEALQLQCDVLRTDISNVKETAQQGYNVAHSVRTGLGMRLCQVEKEFEDKWGSVCSRLYELEQCARPVLLQQLNNHNSRIAALEAALCQLDARTDQLIKKVNKNIRDQASGR